MTTRTVSALLLLFASIYSTQANEVSSIRCNGKFVQPGMDKFKVIALCGTPKASEVISGEDEPKVEKLMYRFKRSSSAPMTLLTFKLGKLHKIEQLK